MHKSTLPEGLRVLKKHIEKGTLRFDLPFQRADHQWSQLQKSLLIHSMLGDYPIPPLYFVKDKEEGKIVHQTLEGQQRLTSLCEFINGDFKLHASTPPVIIEGNTIDLANMTFNELSVEVKDMILGYHFTIYVIEDATEEELEEIFARLNASTPLTLIQKSRTEMGSELAEWTRSMTQFPFFQNAVSFTLSQARKESELEVLLQSMLLMDAKYNDYNYKAISMGEVRKYCQQIRGNYGEQRRTVIQTVIEYLSDAFTEKSKALKKSAIPMVFMMADVAMENDIQPSAFRTFIEYFYSHLPFAYEDNMGSGNIKRAKTEGRLKAIYDDMLKYFNIAARSEQMPAEAKVDGTVVTEDKENKDIVAPTEQKSDRTGVSSEVKAEKTEVKAEVKSAESEVSTEEQSDVKEVSDSAKKKADVSKEEEFKKTEVSLSDSTNGKNTKIPKPKKTK